MLCAVGLAQAQQQVYRCGQEYTNAPVDASRCERVPMQAVTVIPATRVQGLSAAVPAATAAPQAAASGLHQHQRDELARSIVSTELEQARQRHTQLVQEYRQGEPARTPEEMHHPQKYQERVARLRAALERSQRDIDSLQRELMRRPTTASATP
jgi:hypothetical protein